MGLVLFGHLYREWVATGGFTQYLPVINHLEELTPFSRTRPHQVPANRLQTATFPFPNTTPRSPTPKQNPNPPTTIPEPAAAAAGSGHGPRPIRLHGRPSGRARRQPPPPQE
jgi:hypothetical protein